MNVQAPTTAVYVTNVKSNGTRKLDKLRAAFPAVDFVLIKKPEDGNFFIRADLTAENVDQRNVLEGHGVAINMENVKMNIEQNTDANATDANANDLMAAEEARKAEAEAAKAQKAADKEAAKAEKAAKAEALKAEKAAEREAAKANKAADAEAAKAAAETAKAEKAAAKVEEKAAAEKAAADAKAAKEAAKAEKAAAKEAEAKAAADAKAAKDADKAEKLKALHVQLEAERAEKAKARELAKAERDAKAAADKAAKPAKAPSDAAWPVQFAASRERITAKVAVGEQPFKAGTKRAIAHDAMEQGVTMAELSDRLGGYTNAQASSLMYDVGFLTSRKVVKTELQGEATIYRYA